MATTSSNEEEPSAESRCAICWQEITHQIKLPCSHEFCFLCVKGAAMRNNKCPLCRQDVPPGFFDSCTSLNSENMKVATFEGNYHWYYEGRNGWWLFDARVSQELEDEFKNEKTQCEVMIAGFIYIIDFERMIQYRKDFPTRIRKIKRDQTESRTKGIAGLRGNINFV